MKTQIFREGELRVWHIPQIPGKPFHVYVGSPVEAKKLLIALANYDLFQLKNGIRPDYANVNGLEIFEGGEWCEWYDEDGNDIRSSELK